MSDHDFGAVLAMLVQMHLCVPTHFTTQDNRSLEVVVCPMLAPANGAPAAPVAPSMPNGQPLPNSRKQDS